MGKVGEHDGEREKKEQQRSCLTYSIQGHENSGRLRTNDGRQFHTNREPVDRPK